MSEHKTHAPARMIDVGAKLVTHRRARAEGRIHMGAEAFAALQNGTLKKGDPLAQAEVAGIQAAKKTAELLPLCHPLPLDRVVVRCELEASNRSIRVECEAHAHAKTGVEMEALTGTMGALLALYDVLKANDPKLRISDVALVE